MLELNFGDEVIVSLKGVVQAVVTNPSMHSVTVEVPNGGTMTMWVPTEMLRLRTDSDSVARE